MVDGMWHPAARDSLSAGAPLTLPPVSSAAFLPPPSSSLLTPSPSLALIVSLPLAGLQVLRAIRNLSIVGLVERGLHIPPMASRLVRVVFNIACVTHLVSCSFWFTKVPTRRGTSDRVKGREKEGKGSEGARKCVSVFFNDRYRKNTPR